jgi:ubiquinone/menaquinone biosynthesis C-methylase UbiE
MEFDQKDYWDGRFQVEEHFEWLETDEVVVDWIRPCMHAESVVLHMGCGTSTLGVTLNALGARVVNADYSPVVIEKQHRRYPECEWVVMDALNMDAGWEGVFDVVVEKSCMDAIACGDDDQGSRQLQLGDQVARVLTQDGVWIVLSYSKERCFSPVVWETSITHWETAASKVARQQSLHTPAVHHYLYVNKKRSPFIQYLHGSFKPIHQSVDKETYPKKVAALAGAARSSTVLMPR